MRKIELGTIVKDRVTGVVGVAENRATFMYGCDRYCVQPRIKDDGTIPDSVMLDEPQLEILDETPVMPAPAEPRQLVLLGQAVTDPIRGVGGTVTGRAVYLNGCSRVLIASKQTRSQKAEQWWAEEQQVVGKTTLSGRVEMSVAPANTATRRAGGPAPSSSKY